MEYAKQCVRCLEGVSFCYDAQDYEEELLQEGIMLQDEDVICIDCLDEVEG